MKGITGNPALDAYQRFAVKPVSAAPKAQETGVAAPQPQTAAAAKVSISSEARSLAEGEAAVNAQKVDALKTAIADGSFKVDSTVVAQRMLDGVGA